MADTGKQPAKRAAPPAAARKTRAGKASTASKKPPEPLAKQTPAKKVPAAKAATTAPATKAATTASAKQAPVKKAPAKRAPGRKAPTRVRAVRLPVLEGEKPWTAAELSALRGDLAEDAERLRAEIADADDGITRLLRDSGDGAGDDQADAGNKTFEREHEMSLTNNARDLLVQAEHALARIDDGSYGRCESCGNPIGKARLQAFPRATLCLTCKQREERR